MGSFRYFPEIIAFRGVGEYTVITESISLGPYYKKWWLNI